MIEKVLAYITRVRSGRVELLIFTERAHPEAGRQVPAGTVEPDEDVAAALVREVAEESGLTNLRIIRKLAGMEFEYSWMPLDATPRLSGDQDRWLASLADSHQR